jgi:peroxiredoxin
MDGCGHVESAKISPDKCNVCVTMQKAVAKDSPLKALKALLSNHNFLVFIFFHGSECGGCNQYFDTIIPFVKEIRGMGGDVFAVTTLERKDVLITKREWHDHIGVLSDPKIVLAKKFNITVPKTKVTGLTTKKSFFQKLKLATSKDNALSQSHSFSVEDGMVTHREQVSDSPDSQPSILVIKSDEEVMYTWTGLNTPTPLTFTDPNRVMKARVTAQDLMNVARFYFQAHTIPQSIKAYVKNNSERVFELMLSQEDSRKILVEYLKKEFCTESLEFIEDVEDLQRKIEEASSKQRLLGIIMMIYHTYISDNAPKEVNLPSDIKRPLTQLFHRTEGTEVDESELTRFENGQHIFTPAYAHVKLTMRENSFMRLINSKEFMSACSKVIPRCFVSQVPFTQPIICKGI